MDEGYQVQVFLAGSTTGDNELGLFVEEQGPLICSDAPEEEPPSTTSTTAASTTTTTAPAGTAAPATPVSAAATYTG